MADDDNNTPKDEGAKGLPPPAVEHVESSEADAPTKEKRAKGSDRRQKSDRRSKKLRRKRTLKVPEEKRNGSDRRDGKPRRAGKDRRGSKAFDERWLRRQRSPIKTFLETFGIYLSFAVSVLACLTAMTIPGPALINRIPLSISTQQVYRCSCGSCMADSTETAPPDEPEEEVMTPDSDDEGEGEKEKKKKKDPFAGLMMSGGASGPAVKVKFNLAGRQAVPSADTKQDIVVGGN